MVNNSNGVPTQTVRHLNPMVKYEISSPVGEFKTMNVTPYVKSWGDLDILITRDSTSGTYGETSFPVELIGEGRKFIKDLFESRVFKAQADFSIYARDNHDINKYTLIKKMPFDFSTYSDSDNIVSIDCVRAELLEYVNSFGQNKYDIPVNKIKDDYEWGYNRMEMLNQGTYSPVTGRKSYNKVGQSLFYVRLPIYLNSAEITPGTAEHDLKDQKRGRDLTDYFFMADDQVTLNIDVKFRVYCNVIIGSDPQLKLMKVNGSTETSLQAWALTSRETTISYNGEIELVEGDKLIFAVSVEPIYLSASDYYFANVSSGFIEDDYTFTVSYYAKGGYLSIPVIDPQVLMQQYLDEMTGVPNMFTCEIEWNEEWEKYGDIKLVAGESLRGYPLESDDNDKVATLHGSPSEFIKFMRMLGYEHELSETAIKFKPRDQFFRRDVTAMTFTESEVADLKVVANREYAYTQAKIGSKKKDYESINGVFEANFAHEYTTGHKDAEPRELDFTLPFRTDPIGIELLCWERNKPNNDNKSDSDIFAVQLQRNGDVYSTTEDKEYMTPISQRASARIKMFNAVFNPYNLVKRNESLFGIISTEMRFTGNEGAKNITIKDVADNTTTDPKDNIPITKKLFDPVMYDFASGHFKDIPALEKRNGLVYFTYQGQKRKGYIVDARKNYGQNTETTWGLWMVTD